MVKVVGNLGVTPPLSDWEVVGSNPAESMSRIRFHASREEPSMIFLGRKKSFILILRPQGSPLGLFVAVCYCCKITKV